MEAKTVVGIGRLNMVTRQKAMDGEDVQEPG
jgi:hypothetical protein